MFCAPSRRKKTECASEISAPSSSPCFFCPFLAPPPHRGKRNEPAYVAHTARAVAHLWDLSPEDFAKATAANFDRLFTKAATARAAA